MKKLTKSQKEKIKKSIFTGLHILGYICTGIVLLMSIFVGVNGCQPKQQVDSYSNLNLNKRIIKSAYYEYTSGSLYNIDDVGNIKIDKGDFYLVNNDSYIFRDNGATLIASSTIDVKLVNNVGAQYGYRINQIILNSDSFSLALNSTTYTTVNYHNSSAYFLYFLDTCNFTTSGNRYNVLSFFNNLCIKVDNLQYNLDLQSDVSGLFNFSYYLDFVANNWVNAGLYFLHPFVIPYEDLLNGNPTPFRFAPLYAQNQFVGSNFFYQFDLNPGVGLSLYADGNVTNASETYLYHYSLSVYQNQNLGFVNINSGNWHWYFRTYCGCYKFHNLYKNFLVYCYNGDMSSEDFQNHYIDTNLNMSVNLYSIYQTAEYEGGLNNRYLTVVNGGILQYAGVRYDSLAVSYGVAPDGQRDNGWNLYYTNFLNGNSKFVHNNTDPIMDCLIYRIKYLELYNLIINGYNKSVFTKLQGVYDPYFKLGDSTGSAGDVGSSGMGGVFTIFASAFSAIADVFNIQLFGAFTIGSFIFLPLVVSIILFVVALFKR